MAGEEILLESLIASEEARTILAGVAGGILLPTLLIAALFIIAYWIYSSIAWHKIAVKQKNKHPWLSWIPFARSAMRLQMGGIHWAWVFLYIIPYVGWIVMAILQIIVIWRIFNKANYPGWLSLSYIILSITYPVIIGYVAWVPRTKRK